MWDSTCKVRDAVKHFVDFFNDPKAGSTIGNTYAFQQFTSSTDYMRKVFVKTAITVGKLPNISDEQLAYCIEELGNRLEKPEVMVARYKKLLVEHENAISLTKPNWFGHIYLMSASGCGDNIRLEGILSTTIVLKIKMELGTRLSIPPYKLTILWVRNSRG